MLFRNKPISDVSLSDVFISRCQNSCLAGIKPPTLNVGKTKFVDSRCRAGNEREITIQTWQKKDTQTQKSSMRDGGKVVSITAGMRGPFSISVAQLFPTFPASRQNLFPACFVAVLPTSLYSLPNFAFSACADATLALYFRASIPCIKLFSPSEFKVLRLTALHCWTDSIRCRASETKLRFILFLFQTRFEIPTLLYCSIYY